MKKLKKDVIVSELLTLIAQKSLSEHTGNKSGIYYPLEDLSVHLQQKYGIDYHSQQHLYNQLKKYEKNVSMVLFKKNTVDDNIFIRIVNFHQFKHLVILNKSIKLMLANGVLDLIQQVVLPQPDPIDLFLGEGSECYYIAQLLFEKYATPLNVYTNNLGIIQLYIAHSKQLSHITVHTRMGAIQRETYTIRENPEIDNFLSITFNMIILSPRYVKEQQIYEVFSHSQQFNKILLEKMHGIKVMPLTLYEFFFPNEALLPFGTLDAFDYIVLPPEHVNSYIYEHYITGLPLSLIKKYSSYNIYKVHKDRTKRED